MNDADPANAGTQSCGYSYETRIRPPLNPPCLISDQVRDALLDCEPDNTGAIRGCKSKTSDKGSVLESRLCPIGICNTDCKVSSWSEYGPCSQTCGTGSQRRKRSVVRTAGGSGLPCPHLVESRNCRVQDCNADCKVGPFSSWGRCLPVAAANKKAVVKPKSGRPSSSSCARTRSRPVLTQNTGTGASCPNLQEFKNCPCPFGAQQVQLRRTTNNSSATGGANFQQQAMGWVGSIQKLAQQAYAGALKQYQKMGLGWKSVVASAVAACVLCCCLCGCCCYGISRCRQSGKKRKKGEVGIGDMDEPSSKNGRDTRLLQRQDQELEPNEEENCDDKATLLSERQPKPEVRYGERMPQQQAYADRPLNQLPYEASSWQDAAAMYGAGPGNARPGAGFPGMPDYAGATPSYSSSAGPYGSASPYGSAGFGNSGAYGSSGAYGAGMPYGAGSSAYGGGAGALSAPGASAAAAAGSPYSYPGSGAYGAQTGGGYTGRFVDTAPYGGLLDRPPGPASGPAGGYPSSSGYPSSLESRGGPGTLLDYAPQPLHNPPPQYYREAYARGPPNMPPPMY